LDSWKTKSFPIRGATRQEARLSKSVRIRRGALADVAALMRIERTEGHAGLVGQSEAAEHARRLERPDVVVFVAIASEAARAFAQIEGIGDPHGGVYLRRIASDAPGQGFGAALLRHVIDASFADFAAPRFWLDVLAHNDRARRLYAGFGLTEEGVMRASYAMPDGSRADRVIMALLESEWRAGHGRK
jgi:diamine N-acetyltransferase